MLRNPKVSQLQIVHMSQILQTTRNWNSTGEDSVQPDEVSYNYYYCSLLIWFLMPCTAAPLGVAFVAERKWLDSLKEIRLLKPIYFLGLAIVGYFFAFFVVYIRVPLFDLYWGVRNLFCHEALKEDAGLFHEMPAFKLYEQLGEAVPQLTIGLVFYTKNAHWLDPTDLNFGVFTMTLSAVSVLVGIGCGIKWAMEEEDGLKGNFKVFFLGKK